MSETKIKISADAHQAQAALRALADSLSGLEVGTVKAQQQMSKLDNTTKLAVKAFGALTAGLGVQQLVNYTTSWTDLNSRLINATGSQQAATKAMDAISKSANTTFSSLEATAEVFVRNSLALNELGYSTDQQIAVTAALNNAIAISGARGQKAASALDAMAQAMSRGKLEGGDYNRIMESSPQIVQALADGLGVTTGEFRRMITEGKITTSVMIPALIKEMGNLEAKAKAMPATISDAFILLNNSIFKFVGETDKAMKVSESLANIFVSLAQTIEGWTKETDTAVSIIGRLTTYTLTAAGAWLIYHGYILAATAANKLMALSLATVRAGLIKLGIGALIVLFGELIYQTVQAAERLKGWGNMFTLVGNVAREFVDRTISRLTILNNYFKMAGEFIKLGFTEAFIAVTQRFVTFTSILAAGFNKLFGVFGVQIEALGTDALESLQGSSDGIRTTLQTLSAENERLADNVKKPWASVTALMNAWEEGGKKAVEATNSTLPPQKAQVESIKLTDKELKKLIKEYERLQASMDAIRALDPRVAADNKYYDKLFDLEMAYQEGIIRSDKEYYQLRATLEQQYLRDSFNANAQYNEQLLQDRIRTATEEFKLAGWSNTEAKGMAEQRAKVEKVLAEGSTNEKIKLYSEGFGQMLNDLGTFNKEAFQAAKAFNIATAIMDTYSAAQKAFTSLAGIPIVGPALGAVAAGAAIAAGMARVAAIRSQTYSGRQLGGPVMGGQSYIVGENGPEIFTPNNTGSITPNREIGGDIVNINFNIDTVDARGFDQLLSQRKPMIIQMVRTAMNDKGHKSLV